MEHSMVTFRLHRKGVIFVIVGSTFAAALIFVGGYLVAMRRRPSVPVLPATASAPAISTAAQTASAPAPDSEILAVRVGVFDTEEEAKVLVQKLAARKLVAAVVPLTTAEGIHLYTVQVGQYTTREAAAAAASSLAEEPGLQPAVVPAGR